MPDHRDYGRPAASCSIAPSGFGYLRVMFTVADIDATLARLRKLGHVLARGAVRHLDHATIHLRSWHEVHINDEVRPASLGFLD